MSFSVTAFAITEAEVEAQVSASGRESVTGNVLIWFLCAIAFLKVSQKIDSFMSALGVNVGNTGGSMLAEAMIATRTVATAAGSAGRSFGGGGGRSPSGSGGSSGGGSDWFLKGGLAGVVSRKVTNDAVKSATSTTSAVKSSQSSTTAKAAQTTVHSAASRQSAHSSQTRSATQSSAQSRTASTSAQRSSSTTASHTAHMSSRQSASAPAFRGIGIGGAMFARSLLTGGSFANDVIGKVAKGDIRTTGSMTGELAAQALASYGGLTALGDAAPKASFSDVEIGGGRITGTEYTPAHPKGIAFGMYHADQYTQPAGDFQKVVMADGSKWYKQYATDTVVKTPFKAPDGEIDYYKDIAKKLPDPPKRKDRI